MQGDDPLPDSISLRADGTAAVIRGGGHGGFRTVQVELGDAVAARATRLAEHAPWKALDGRTVTPGGFGGWDNDMRYMLRRGQRSVTVTRRRHAAPHPPADPHARRDHRGRHRPNRRLRAALGAVIPSAANRRG